MKKGSKEYDDLVKLTIITALTTVASSAIVVLFGI